ncbi:MAG: asparaginase [Rhodoferax sp.]|uniref:asparaginase n=1 Tax=Rhodoferax sp. TaxID=50421 RepID=UPI00183477EB|nr:asparaginase [Rhodoferax sp.]NMM13053.1 asparaginase [Rhodoferax sp.]NMM19331.1 asparaginase [Rhodoferax sp.]
MQVTSTDLFEKVVVLGTGGTIAGTAPSASDNLGYTAAQVGVSQLLDAIPGLSKVLAGRSLLSEQVAQIDSKDMSFSVWQQLALRVQHHLTQPDVQGVVITHGTDTLEETAYFLYAVLPVVLLARKPVVLTCAMRPASSAAPDGPQNVMDAVAVAITPGACGVVVVCAGTLHGAVAVQKVHPYRLDAFNSGDAGPLGYVEEGGVRLVRNWPLAPVDSEQVAIELIANVSCWPRVEIVMNYAGANGALVDALVAPVCPTLPVGGPQDAQPVRGLVVAATGNGTVHRDLEAALIRAQTAGVKVVLATRCPFGRVLPGLGRTFPDSQGLSPVKARVALMLALLP